MEPDLRQLIVPRSLAAVRDHALQREFVAARQVCETLAHSGDADAQSCFAAMLLDGVGGARDAKQAERWARESARAGSGYGAYLLAQIAYRQSHKALAMRWMRRAAELEFVPSFLGLGRFLALGIGTEIDTEAGLRSYREAQTRGHRLASFSMWDLRRCSAKRPAARWYAGVRQLWSLVVNYPAIVLHPFDETTRVRNFAKSHSRDRRQ